MRYLGAAKGALAAGPAGPVVNWQLTQRGVAGEVDASILAPTKPGDRGNTDRAARAVLYQRKYQGSEREDGGRIRFTPSICYKGKYGLAASFVSIVFLLPRQFRQLRAARSCASTSSCDRWACGGSCMLATPP